MTEARQRRWHAALEAAARLQPVARGTQPRRLLASQGPFRLYRYTPERETTAPPVLLVYSLVNRPDLLDLAPGTSLIAALGAAGAPVYLVDWGYPTLADGVLDLEDYVTDFLQRAYRIAAADAGRTPLLAGVCQGGTLSLMLAARLRERIPALALVAAPVDFHAGAGLLSRLARCWPMPVDKAAPGLISGDRLTAGFMALRPADLLLRRYLPLPDMADDSAALETFLRMEAWMYDCPDQPAPMFHRFLQECYLDNALHQGRMLLAGETVQLSTVDCALLNVYACEDHLVPPESSLALRAMKEPAGRLRYAELGLPGGHLGLFLSRRNRRKLVDAILTHAQKYLCRTG